MDPQKTVNVYLQGHIKSRPISVLLDTGSYVSLAPYELIEKHKCRLRKSATTTLKAANGSDVIIAGESTIPLCVTGKHFHTVVLVSRDVSETILGINWLREHECNWDFPNERVRFTLDGEWIPLTGKSQPACRRIYVEKDVTIPPDHVQIIPARATLLNIRRIPQTATIEPRQLQKGVYIGRTLVPPEHDKARVCVVNVTKRSVLVPAGTSLGQLQPAQLLEPAGSTSSPSTAPEPAKAPADESDIPKLMDGLQDELNAEQRKAARQLFQEYEDVFSKNEFDIGRTPLVEFHIDTGESATIGQSDSHCAGSL